MVTPAPDLDTRQEPSIVVGPFIRYCDPRCRYWTPADIALPMAGLVVRGLSATLRPTRCGSLMQPIEEKDNNGCRYCQVVQR